MTLKFQEESKKKSCKCSSYSLNGTFRSINSPDPYDPKLQTASHSPISFWMFGNWLCDQYPKNK